MLFRFIFIFLILFLLQACSSKTRYSIDSYRQTNNEVEKQYKLKRADLVLSYDLARVDNTNCIYSEVLGLVANERNHAQKYLHKFKSRYKSKAHLSQEAKKKILKICKLLAELQSKYHILSGKNNHYVTKLSKTDLNKVDMSVELAKLDRIISHIPLMLPSYKACISSNYGPRKHPITRQQNFHCGMDMIAQHKAPVYSSAYGRVSFAGVQNGYGTIVEIDHGNNIKTKYAHLTEVFVRKGQKVIRGQIIGIQGKTGNARGEHLHFEVHINGSHVNPYDFIGYNYECTRR